MSTVHASAGHEVHECEDGASAQSDAQSRPYEILVLDHDMPVMKGLEIAAYLRARGSKIAILIVSTGVSELIAEGVPGMRFLKKPFAGNVLVSMIQSLAAGFCRGPS